MKEFLNKLQEDANRMAKTQKELEANAVGLLASIPDENQRKVMTDLFNKAKAGKTSYDEVINTVKNMANGH